MQAENPSHSLHRPRYTLPLALRVGVLLALCATGFVLPAHAGEATPYAAPQTFSVPSTGTGGVRVVLALMLVLAAIYGAGWIMRRLRQFSGASATGLQVLAQVGLGARERAVLLRAGDQQLLLGVANGSVRLLCELRPGNGLPTLPVTPGAPTAPAAPSAPATPARPNFRELLLRSIGK
jgi:flagellar biosynthetic protein FliO